MFIKDGSPQEVNISSDQRQVLLDNIDLILNSNRIVDENKEKELFKNIFNDSKNEIMHLLNRNFLGKFVKKERKKELRLKQMESMSGCFSSLFHQSGK